MEATLALFDSYGGIEKFDIVTLREVSSSTGQATPCVFMKILISAIEKKELSIIALKAANPFVPHI
jgi:hypothetical protein